MSDYGAYDNERARPYRNQTTRVRRRERDEPEYVEETTFVERGKGPPPREIVSRQRQRDRDDDVEEIPRDFPPPERRPLRGYRDDYEPPRRARSVASRRYDDDFDDYAAPAAAGAGAGYAAGRARGERDGGRGGPPPARGGYDRRRERRDYYSEDESPPRRRERSREKKSQLTEALEGLGLGGLVGAISGKERSRSRNRGGGRRDSRESSRSRSGKKERQWAQAAQAAVVAGAIEAFRSRGEPGSFFSGEKAKRIATAAISAGGIDKLVDRDPDSKGKLHLLEAVTGGLVANRLANGPREGPEGEEGGSGRGRSQSRARSGSVMDRFRSKSRAGSDEDRGRGNNNNNGIEKLAAGGAIIAAGKAIYDRVRSKSRRRSPSNSSDDSYVPSRARRGRDREVGPYSPGDRGEPPDQNAVVGPQRGRGEGREQSRQRKGRSSSTSSNSSLSSTDIEERRKKLRGKEFVTAGLASIATIHAAHGVYQSMEASDKRHKLVAEGEMSPEEARKKRSKAWLQDAAAVGIAALGIKGAYSEWKEMNEQRHSVKELEERRRKRRKRQEKRMKNAREGGEGRGGPYMAGGRGPRDDGYYNAPYPYASGNVPPPPMGGAPYGR